MNYLEKKDIRELLAEAKKFCSGIAGNEARLGLDEMAVALFNVDVELLGYILNHDDSFTESFISYKAISIQWRLTDMLTACVNSENLTDEVASEIGLILPLNNTRGLSSMNLKWSSEQTYLRA